MGLLTNMLTLPVMGAPRLVSWLARTIAQEAQRTAMDEGPVRDQLLKLQELYDAGVLAEEEYDRQEGALLEHLNAVRELRRAQ
ncbi:MAG: gas vesicle protein GvpG [Chloroflexota bacterium]